MITKRQTRKQKKAFRDVVVTKFPQARVDSHVVAKNVIIGDVATADVIVSAHYDTPPKLPTWFVKHLVLWGMILVPAVLQGWFMLMFRLPLWVKADIIYDNLEIYFTAVLVLGYGSMMVYIAHLFGLTPLANKVNLNDNTSGVAVVLDMAKRLQNNPRYAFVLFDNEEKGLFGSIAFRRKYNDVLKGKRIVVIDCVGLGDVLNLFTWGEKTDVVSQIETMQDDVALDLKHKRSTIMSMSDHFSFRGLNAVLMLANYSNKHKRNSLATIHTRKDDNIKPSNLYQIMRLIENI